MSDSHDRWDNLERAIDVANDAKCELLLFAGDLIAPTGISVLEKFDGESKFVWGNNEGERVRMTLRMHDSKRVELCGDVYEGEVGGVRIFMNHYPRITELAAKSREFDLCIFGHTHAYHHEMIDACLLINPGEIQGFGTGVSTFVIFDTQTKKGERIFVEQ